MFHTLLFNSNISDISSPRKEGERNVNLTDYSDGMKSNRFIGQCGLADHRIEKDGGLEEFGSTGQFVMTSLKFFFGLLSTSFFNSGVLSTKLTWSSESYSGSLMEWPGSLR